MNPLDLLIYFSAAIATVIFVSALIEKWRQRRADRLDRELAYYHERQQNMLKDRGACRCCREQYATCADPHLGDVCGSCKAQLVIMDFNLRDVADECGAAGFRRQPHEVNL